MITDTIQRAMQKRLDRDYNFTYWAIDIHDTIVPATYKNDGKYDFSKYDLMLDTLKLLSVMPDMKIILWSCTAPSTVDHFKSLLSGLYDINIDYFNENPECETKDLYNFNGKFYFDLLLDDKAGFDPENDWVLIYKHLRTIYAFGIEEYMSRAKNGEIAMRIDTL